MLPIGLGDMKTLKFLISKKGINLNLTDKFGQTVLHHLVAHSIQTYDGYYNMNETVQVLFENGFNNFSAVDKDGKTALDLRQPLGVKILKASSAFSESEKDTYDKMLKFLDILKELNLNDSPL